ncbi:MAG: exo-alpha-sialidase, partial [Bacteroidales bacterium]|nr:exo-alpha-sialidase [Bacteroidales bacterium]
ETSDGTIFVANDESFSEWYSQPAIFYSKDEGKTWHEAEMMFGFKTGEIDSLHTYYTDIHIEEMTFEELPDGKTVRCFARTGHGFVYYMDSTDGGKTWGELRPTQLINPLVTYNIEQDLNDPNVYYAVTMYSANTESYHENDRNRSRQALFKSFDGMKTWEFVGTLSETVGWNNPSRANTATKAYGDTLYISDNGNSEDSFALIYAIDPSKLKTKKRHESPHTALIQHRQENIGFMQFRDRFDEISFLPETSGRASIYGSNFDITVKDGMYDAETIGKVFGAVVVKSGKTVTFKIGEGYVKFTEGSKDYVVDGVTKTFTSACMKNGYFNIEACAEAFERQYEKYEGMNVIDLYNE